MNGAVAQHLKLLAEDAADLEIVASAVQDALVRVGELKFEPKARRFVVLMNRFRWEAAGDRGPFERVRAALSFESVLSVKSRNVRQDAHEALAAVLSITFVQAPEPPGGTIAITLAGGGEIALEVECLDAVLLDLGEPWRTPRRPDHEA